MNINKQELVRETTKNSTDGTPARKRRKYDNVLRASTPNPLARVCALVRLGRHHDAAAAAEEVLKHDPKNLSAMEVLAKMLWQTGQMESVVSTTRSLILLNPYEPGYHLLQAAALQCLGRYGESARAYMRAGKSREVDDALADLNAWQAGLVAEMLATDTVFRAHYAQNPAAACSARGFSFLGGDPSQDRWLVNSSRKESMFTRPS